MDVEQLVNEALYLHLINSSDVVDGVILYRPDELAIKNYCKENGDNELCQFANLVLKKWNERNNV